MHPRRNESGRHRCLNAFVGKRKNRRLQAPLPQAKSGNPTPLGRDLG